MSIKIRDKTDVKKHEHVLQRFLASLALTSVFLLTPALASASTTYLIVNADTFLDRIRSEYGQMINIASLLHDYDSKMITAVIVVESEGKTLALSHKGARGLMQLMPGTAKAMGATDAKDPFQNILAGTRYLRELEVNYGFDDREALVAYNMGPSRAKRWLSQYDAKEYGYVKKVMYVYDLLTQKELAEKNLAIETIKRLESPTRLSSGVAFSSSSKHVSLAMQPFLIPYGRKNIIETIDE